MNANRKKIHMIVGTAVLAAIVIVLQTIASGIKIGPFTVTLSLVPIILGGVMYGPLSSTVLGGVFGAVVTAAVISGADVGGAMMFQKNPVLTVLLCMVKALVAGFAAGIIADSLAKRGKVTAGVFLAALAAPICNTGIFVLGGSLFFMDIFKVWATANGETNVALYIVAGLIGVNFLIEVLVGVIMVPIINQIIRAISKRR